VAADAALLKLPYFAATAWFPHKKKLPADLQGKDLTAMLPEVEDLLSTNYFPF
jgi:hypothetical protein